MNKLRRWRQTTIANQMLAGSSILLTISTAGLVIVGTLQYFTSRNQLGAMQNMIGQNERLIKASSDQANASAKSANVMDTEKQAVLDSAQAAKDSASTANIAIGQNKELIKATQIQANASQVSARAAREGVQAVIAGQRPRFNIELVKGGVLSSEEVFRIDIKATNTGQSTALNTRLTANMRHGFAPVPSNIPFVTPPEVSRVDLGPGMSTVLPFIMRRFTTAEIEEFESGKRLMRVLVRLTYDNEFGSRDNVRQWCLMYDHTAKGMGFCP